MAFEYWYSRKPTFAAEAIPRLPQHGMHDVRRVLPLNPRHRKAFADKRLERHGVLQNKPANT